MSETDTQDKIKALGRRNNIIVIVLAAILVIVAALYFLQNREHKQIVTELNAEKDSIQSELSDIFVSYDSLQTENDTINEQLFLAQTKVKDLLIEVEQTKKVSISKINAYQKELTTLRGIMRDFVVQIDSLNRRNQELIAENIEVKEQSSQGQQRIIVICMKLGEIEIIKENTKEYPILLLDDIFSELDENKKNNILKYLKKEIQTFITTTDINKISSNLLKNGNIYLIKNQNIIKKQ